MVRFPLYFRQCGACFLGCCPMHSPSTSPDLIMEPLTQPRLPRAWETDKVPRTQCSFLLIIFHHVTVFSLKGFILIKLSPWPKYIYQKHLLSIECNLILFHSSNPTHFPRFSSNPTSSAVACSYTMAWPCLSFLSNPAFNISVIFIFHYTYGVLPSYPELISHSPNTHSLCPGYFFAGWSTLIPFPNLEMFRIYGGDTRCKSSSL